MGVLSKGFLSGGLCPRTAQKSCCHEIKGIIPRQRNLLCSDWLIAIQ